MCKITGVECYGFAEEFDPLGILGRHLKQKRDREGELWLCFLQWWKREETFIGRSFFFHFLNFFMKTLLLYRFRGKEEKSNSVDSRENTYMEEYVRHIYCLLHSKICHTSIHISWQIVRILFPFSSKMCIHYSVQSPYILSKKVFWNSSV